MHAIVILSRNSAKQTLYGFVMGDFVLKGNRLEYRHPSP